MPLILIKVCRIQNLHISQTFRIWVFQLRMFVEFKIYISLKRLLQQINQVQRLQNSKFTYLSNVCFSLRKRKYCLQNSKFTYLSNSFLNSSISRAVCRIQNLHISQTLLFLPILFILFVEFKIYISLKRKLLINFVKSCLQNSKFTYLSNINISFTSYLTVCRIQNLHISQTSSN